MRPGIDHPVADRLVLGPEGDQSPAELDRFPPPILLPDREDLLAGGGVVVGQQVTLPLHAQRAKHLVDIGKSGKTAAHIATIAPRPGANQQCG